MHHYPDAKVLLTAREPEKWHDSVKKTIFQKRAFLKDSIILMWLKIVNKRDVLNLASKSCETKPSYCDQSMLPNYIGKA